MKVRIWTALGCFLLLSIMSLTAESDDTLIMAADTRQLEPGDNQIHGFTYFNGYLWASTRTNPCRILRIDAETLNYDRIILDQGLNDGEDLIAAEGHIWVILWTAPSKIVRVDPETLEWEVAVVFQPGELFQGGSLEYAYGYLWAGGRNGKIARIDLNDLSYQVYDYSTATGNFQFHAMTSGGGYIWGSSYSYRNSWLWGVEYLGNTIVRVNPDDPADYSSVYIDDATISDDMAYVDGHLYAGSERMPSYLYKISDDLTYSKTKGGDTTCYGVFARDDRIWGAYVGTPGRIARFDLDLNLELDYQLPSTCSNANEMVFDPNGNLYYVTCWESPAGIVKLERKEIHYFISSAPHEGRGGVIIPIEVFPEGEGAVIPIHVPSVVNNSNQVREDGDWRTVKEIKRSELNFEWEKLVADFRLEGADTPAGAGLSAIAGLIQALHSAISVYDCRISIQSDPSGDLRAIVQAGDPDSRTFMRAYAGETWMPFVESFWLIQAVFSGQIAGTFDLEPDDFPGTRYTMTLDVDPAHKDDPYIGYLSVSQDSQIVMTPVVYPQDRLEILRVHQLVIPYKIERVMELAVHAFASLMEGPVEPGFLEMLSALESEPAIVVQGRSPIELRVYDSQSRVTGMVDGEVRSEVPRSIYDPEHRIVMILSPDDAYLYEVAGMEQGEYGLEAGLVEGGESTLFNAERVPVSDSAVHQYAIDWTSLSRGEDGVAVKMDTDGDGVFEYSMVSDSQLTWIEYLVAIGVTPDGKHPTTWAGVKRTALFQNYPNPFNPDTWIPYALAEQAQVTIRIYAVSGELVRTLNLGNRPPGVHMTKQKAAHWDGRDDFGTPVASGVYFYTLYAGSFRATRKAIIVR